MNPRDPRTGRFKAREIPPVRRHSRESDGRMGLVIIAVLIVALALAAGSIFLSVAQ